MAIASIVLTIQETILMNAATLDNIPRTLLMNAVTVDIIPRAIACNENEGVAVEYKLKKSKKKNEEYNKMVHKCITKIMTPSSFHFFV